MTHVIFLFILLIILSKFLIIQGDIMEIIHDKNQLNYFINKNKINEYFSPEHWEFYRNAMMLVCFSKNECIFNSSKDTLFLYFFIDGKIKVMANLSNGKRQLLYIYTKGGIIGDLEMFDMGNPYTTVEVISKTYCVAMNLAITKEFLFKDSTFLLYMSKNLAYKLSRSSSNGALLMYYALENKLCSYINASATELQDSKRIYTESLSETAELLGASYRHLQRILKSLCEKNILEKQGKYYLIIDEKKLTDMAEDIYINN